MALQRYAALLRGVSPMNAKMPALKRSFEDAGFSDVATLLSSGNVVFSARAASDATLQREAEAAMQAGLGRSFQTIVRRLDALRRLLEADPFSAFPLPAGRKRVITFLRAAAAAQIEPPVHFADACIHAVRDREIFSSCLPGDKGTAFMRHLEKTFGKDVTTRTWDTVAKIASR